MTVPFIVRIILFPVVLGSKLLSYDLEDVLAVTRNLFLMAKYGYEIMKNMGRVWSRDKIQMEENRKWKANWPHLDFKLLLFFQTPKIKSLFKQISRLSPPLKILKPNIMAIWFFASKSVKTNVFTKSHWFHRAGGAGWKDINQWKIFFILIIFNKDLLLNLKHFFCLTPEHLF